MSEREVTEKEVIQLVSQYLREALDALRELHDWQNGPPLLTPKWEKGWRAAMGKAESVLKKHGA